MTERAEIGARIAAFAESNGWSKSFLANVVGVHQQNVNRYLTGKSDPSKIIISLISYGLNPEWAKTGEGDMYVEKKEALKAGSTTVKPLVNTNGRFNFMNPTEPYFYEAIGRRLAVQEENIMEGDVLIVDPTLPAVVGDLLLRSSPEGPEFARYQPGEKNLKGVVLALTRQYPATYRKEQ